LHTDCSLPKISLSDTTKVVVNVQGFVQVGNFEFRLLDNVSQIYKFKLMISCLDE
jgi:hypothetical protein